MISRRGLAVAVVLVLGAACGPTSIGSAASPGARRALLLDGASHSIFSIDVAGRRVLGRGPVVRAVDGSRVRLPGKPLLVSSAIPQDVARVGAHLAVAGGDDGSVALVPLKGVELGTPRRLVMPPVEIDYGGGTVRTDTPFVVAIGSTPGGRVVALGVDATHRTSIGYLIDPDSGAVVAHKQLPAGPLAVATTSRLLLVSFSDNVVLSLGEQLETLATYSLPAPGFTLSATDREAYVGFNEPARLARLDLGTGAVTVVAEAGRQRLAGPSLVSRDSVWWALPEEGVIRQLTPSGSRTHVSKACRGAKHLAASGDVLVVTCLGGGQLALVPFDGGEPSLVKARGFPTGLAVVP